jgi:hypothetical protein
MSSCNEGRIRYAYDARWKPGILHYHRCDGAQTDLGSCCLFPFVHRHSLGGRPAATNRRHSDGEGCSTTATVCGSRAEFDSGSMIQLAQLTPLQIENRATLARFWGFLKYYDALITAGKGSWEFDLFRVMPAALAVQSLAESNALLVNWIDSLGPIDACNPCASFDPTKGELKPDIAWIGDIIPWCSAGSPARSYLPEPCAKSTVLSGTHKCREPHLRYERNHIPFPFPDSGYHLLGLSVSGTWWSTGLAIAMWSEKIGLTFSPVSSRASPLQKIKIPIPAR